MYLMGDIHGNIFGIMNWMEQVKESKTKREQSRYYLCVLGDAGINYYLDKRDRGLKEQLQNRINDLKRNGIEVQILFVRGNHDCRPENIYTYHEQKVFGGVAYVETEEFSDLLFLKDGEIYHIEDKAYLVLGGGYSKDFFKRILNNSGWWPDEQLSKEEWQKIFGQLDDEMSESVTILSHMLPKRVLTWREEMEDGEILTEQFLDQVFERYQNYIQAWYAGHYHLRREWCYESIPIRILDEKEGGLI